MPAAFAAVHDDYAAVLERAPLDADTRRAYASRILAFLAWLDAADLDNADPLSDAHGRDFAVRDYKTYLKAVAKRNSSTSSSSIRPRR